MLYDLLRSVSKIELFYKLRGAGAGPRRFTSERIGHTGRTTAYKELRRTLIHEGVLSKEGVFVENGPNVWLARLPERVQDPRVAVYVGRRIPYLIFLALVLKEGKDFESPYRFARVENPAHKHLCRGQTLNQKRAHRTGKAGNRRNEISQAASAMAKQIP